MDPDAGAVDHHDVPVVSLGDCVQNMVPDPDGAPPDEPVAERRGRAVALGKAPPRRADPEPLQIAI
jgi:hypothetical protein